MFYSRFEAVDDEGAEAVPLTVEIRMCGCVLDQGICLYDNPTNPTSTDPFQLVFCDCYDAWDGTAIVVL